LVGHWVTEVEVQGLRRGVKIGVDCNTIGLEMKSRWTPQWQDGMVNAWAKVHS